MACSCPPEVLILLQLFQEPEAHLLFAVLHRDVEHLDLDQIALLDDLLYGLHAALGQLGDVHQAVGSRLEAHKGAEVDGRSHPADDYFARLDLLGDALDPVRAAFAARAVGRVDLDHAVVIDLDGAIELVLEPADGLAALTDDRTDLVGVDLDGEDPRSEFREYGAGFGDHRIHLIQDRKPSVLGLSQGVSEDLEGDTGDLDVHLQGGNTVFGPRHFEVHVAQVIFYPGDIGQHDVIVLLLDQAHGDSGDRRLEGHAAVQESERGAAYAGHRARAVGLQNLGDQADRVRELLVRRDHGKQGPLGKQPVSNLPAAGAAHEAGLAHGEGRELVVVHVALGIGDSKALDPLLISAGAQRQQGEYLRLAPGEETAAVRPRRHAHFRGDLADLGGRASVG